MWSYRLSSAIMFLMVGTQTFEKIFRLYADARVGPTQFRRSHKAVK